MPRGKALDDRARAERRRAILEAAIPLFVANGFSQTSVSDVARAAGVAHGTVFLYFASKEELFRAALVEPLAEMEPLFTVDQPPGGTPLERIRHMVQRQVRALAGQEHFLRLTQYVLGQRERFPELARVLFKFADRFTLERLAPVVQAGQDRGELAPGTPEVVAWSYFSYLNGVALVTLDPESSAVWGELAENGLRLFRPLHP